MKISIDNISDNKLKIKETIVVEGKYDLMKVNRICDAPIVCTDGFGIFKSKEKAEALRTLARTTGLIVLTDSDRAGFLIRSHIKKLVGKDGVVKHAYIPSVAGKERRKQQPGKEGLLGVEGIDDEMLRKAVEAVASPRSDPKDESEKLTKKELYADGLSGRESSAEKRRRVLKKLGLPPRLSASAMIDIINSGGSYQKYKAALKEEKEEEEEKENGSKN